MEIWNSFIDYLVQILVWMHTALAGLGLGTLSWGFAIILFTVAVRVITFPLTVKQLKSSKAMAELQPQLKELQKKYGKDREKMMQEQMRLYKEANINPALGCLPLLIQMPIWFALYQALFKLAADGGTEGFAGSFLWLPSLATPEPAPYILALLTGASQWVLQRMMTPQSTDATQKTMNNMMQFMPIMFVFFAFSVPSGLVVYWVTSNLIGIIQQYFTMGWGALFPLPFIGGPVPATKAAVRQIEPSANGKRPALTEQAPLSGSDRPARISDDGLDSSRRGPGGGRRKRIKRG